MSKRNANNGGTYLIELCLHNAWFRAVYVCTLVLSSVCLHIVQTWF